MLWTAHVLARKDNSVFVVVFCSIFNCFRNRIVALTHIDLYRTYLHISGVVCFHISFVLLYMLLSRLHYWQTWFVFAKWLWTSLVLTHNAVMLVTRKCLSCWTLEYTYYLTYFFKTTLSTISFFIYCLLFVLF